MRGLHAAGLRRGLDGEAAVPTRSFYRKLLPLV
jgi:hypothetical protein